LRESPMGTRDQSKSGKYTRSRVNCKEVKLLRCTLALTTACRAARAIHPDSATAAVGMCGPSARLETEMAETYDGLTEPARRSGRTPVSRLKERGQCGCASQREASRRFVARHVRVLGWEPHLAGSPGGREECFGADLVPEVGQTRMSTTSILDVRDLSVFFRIEGQVVRAVDGISYSIEKEKTLGIVGESGCGKTVTGLSIMGLVQTPPGRIESGAILYHRDGQLIDLAKLRPKGRQIRAIRGNEIAMIFQEPMTSLNPVYTIGKQIVEAITLHQKLGRKQARAEAIRMLRAVGIPLPEQRVDEYPHQLSGGMRQRAMIAMALSCNPSLLIADEPTTALDVTIQAQVLDLMNNLRTRFNTAIQFITHDLGVIAGMADDVVVMYLGKIVEGACVREIFHAPKHPYTQGLMNSIPSLVARRERLEPIKGVVPDPFEVPEGCGFEPRCPRAMEACKTRAPALREVSSGHAAACWLYEER